MQSDAPTPSPAVLAITLTIDGLDCDDYGDDEAEIFENAMEATLQTLQTIHDAWGALKDTYWAASQMTREQEYIKSKFVTTCAAWQAVLADVRAEPELARLPPLPVLSRLSGRGCGSCRARST